ncbi:MAG: site-specific integrase [Chthoniobacterales bacterium]
MACIWKHPKSKYWIARFLSADGEYKNRSTKETDSKKARKTAEDWEKVERMARRGVLVEAQAREVLNEILERTTGDRLQTHSCREWLEEWIKGKQGTTAGKTMLKYTQVTRDFLGHLGKRADLPLTAISIQDFRSFRDKLAEGGRSPQTVNQLLHKTLTIPFNKARRLGLIPMNPLVAVESLTEDPGERDIFTTEQIGSLLEVARDDWRGVILAGFYTGLRLIDITNLRWSNIDVAAGCITLYAQKSKRTKRRIIIPIHDDLADWLSSRPSSDVDGFIFPSLAGKAVGGSSGLSRQFRKIMEKAGVVGRVIRYGKGAGRRIESLSFHSLRHSFNSALANAGVSQELRQALTGHMSARDNERYTHRQISLLRTAIEQVPRIKPSI